MSEQTQKQNRRCPACGQRIAIDRNQTGFTCLNCRTIQTIPDRMPAAPEGCAMGSEEFMDIWRNPCRYTKKQRMLVWMELSSTPIDQWPEEIQQAQKESAARLTRYKRTKLIARTLFVLFLLYLMTLIR